jgi:DNA-binding NarL/FixJ family response regulator
MTPAMTPTRTRHRVLVADARPSVRLGLTAALERDGFEVVAQGGTSEEAASAAAETRPDACLIDAQLRGGGLVAARRIKSRLPETEIVITTEALSDVELLEALRAGASGYLLKRSEPEHFAIALRGVLAGDAAIPRVLVGGLIEDLSSMESTRRRQIERRLGVQFTTREWQVMDGLLRRLNTDEVAAALGISAVTVRRHVSDAVRKLGVENRAAALGRLAEAGATELRPRPDPP